MATSTSSRSSYTPLSSQVARPTSTVGASYGGSQGSARPVIGASGHSPIGLAPANGSSSSQYGQDLRQTTTSVGGELVDRFKTEWSMRTCMTWHQDPARFLWALCLMVAQSIFLGKSALPQGLLSSLYATRQLDVLLIVNVR